jgi:hypothetical protein
VKKVLSRIGTVVIGLAMLGGGALVLWNVFGQGPYGDTCSFSLGCRSFYCLSHQLRGTAQVSSKGHCTKSCDADSDCGAGAACVVLTEASRDDFPPFGKPDKACMITLEMPADIRQ